MHPHTHTTGLNIYTWFTNVKKTFPFNTDFPIDTTAASSLLSFPEDTRALPDHNHTFLCVVLLVCFFFPCLLVIFHPCRRKTLGQWTFQRRLPCFKFIKNILYKNGLKTFSVFYKVSECSGFAHSQNTGRCESVGPCGGRWAARTLSLIILSFSREELRPARR